MGVETNEVLKERLKCLSTANNCKKCGFPERHSVCAKYVAKVCLEMLNKDKQLISLDEARAFLRIDNNCQDSYISDLIEEANTICLKEAKLSDTDWNGLRTDVGTREIMRIGMSYSIGYLYEHNNNNEEYHDLKLMLRNILFSIRERKV